MTMHSFTLILDATYATDAQMDAVAAVSDELMLCSSGGRAFVAVDREADTLDTAERSDITEVEQEVASSNPAVPTHTTEVVAGTGSRIMRLGAPECHELLRRCRGGRHRRRSLTADRHGRRTGMAHVDVVA